MYRSPGYHCTFVISVFSFKALTNPLTQFITEKSSLSKTKHIPVVKVVEQNFINSGKQTRPSVLSQKTAKTGRNLPLDLLFNRILERVTWIPQRPTELELLSERRHRIYQSPGGSPIS
jgi:hypothetical protein